LVALFFAFTVTFATAAPFGSKINPVKLALLT